ncbi:uroporphyrin-3 C-methyltransferase/uroporphyrinogen III methyltransferase / synthase [Noviherbaspirillum humi]|uniref:Uroporphyrin-3 C-methyltransferase/uroporphyrinogen III methyltransferase / synthase n=1 Tax=Noviherbaspirillum humi TaxID=1688639 RepID=A0A239GTF6_9BURK|nr:uroporphyrinogen-III C-methyltransferase [Noviherbaspirillum humi]SNS72407.1 uroporphyrin-3 C-methyltransferase/uroporphyrinogen III methyltransferase / synthase [Noviherbaspirillum humi]
MNDLPTSSDHPTSSQNHAEASRNGASSLHSGDRATHTDPLLRQTRRIAFGGLGALTLLIILQAWSTHTQLSMMREEVAQRLKNGDAVNAENRVLLKSIQDAVKEMQSKVSVLESRQQESQSQQLALEQLYQDLARNRDDWALAEIEQVLSTASQQLQLAGNVQGALIALQNADAKLSHSDKPQFINIRRAIARDQDKLKALPSIDLTGTALRLDSIIAQIDGMPLLADEKPAASAPAQRGGKPGSTGGGAAKPGVIGSWLSGLNDAWHSWTDDMWSEVRQLIRVRNVETSDALLLSPTQAYYVRENLKLRLLNARLALLSRNESGFRGDLNVAQETIVRFFDTRARQTQTVQSQLRQVQGSTLAIEMPTLADSLNAVRNYKAKP